MEHQAVSSHIKYHQILSGFNSSCATWPGSYWPDNQLGLSPSQPAFPDTELDGTERYSCVGSPSPVESAVADNWAGPPVPTVENAEPSPSQEVEHVEPEKATVVQQPSAPVPHPKSVPLESLGAMPSKPDRAQPPPSQGAVDRRLRRLLQPNAKGEFKVSEEVRKLWADGEKSQVFKLFAKCDNDPEKFVKQHSVNTTKERELEVGVFFKFLLEEEFKDKSEKLRQRFFLHLSSKLLDECLHCWVLQFHGTLEAPSKRRHRFLSGNCLGKRRRTFSPGESQIRKSI